MNLILLLSLIYGICLFQLSFALIDISGKIQESESEGTENALSKLSKAILATIEHYKQPDPVGIPNAPIPDPMPVPDLKHSKTFPSVTLRNSSVYGLSKFKIELLESNLAVLQVDVALFYSKLEVIGNYSLSSWFSKSTGGYNVTLEGVYFESVANMQVAAEGNLEATDIEMDITFNSVAMDFENIGLLGRSIQGIMNTGGSFVFDNIKPFLLKEVNTNIRRDINEMLKTLNQMFTFPNSLPPIDVAVAKLRTFVKEQNVDPLGIPNYNTNAGLMALEVQEINVSGLATFYRNGNLSVTIANNTVYASLSMSTQVIKGSCKWAAWIAGLYTKQGTATFTIDYIQIDTKLNQSLDIRNKPKLESLQIKLGNLQLRFQGLGTFDYLFEFLMNTLPNLLRNQILHVSEGFLLARVQDLLDAQDLEKMIISHLNDFITKEKNIETTLESISNDYDFEENYQDLTI